MIGVSIQTGLTRCNKVLFINSFTRIESHYCRKNSKKKDITKTFFFFFVKFKSFQKENFDIFLIFAQNIDCEYTLEPPRRGGSNEYPQSMFRSKNKKNRYTPAYPNFTI